MSSVSRSSAGARKTSLAAAGAAISASSASSASSAAPANTNADQSNYYLEEVTVPAEDIHDIANIDNLPPPPTVDDDGDEEDLNSVLTSLKASRVSTAAHTQQLNGSLGVDPAQAQQYAQLNPPITTNQPIPTDQFIKLVLRKWKMEKTLEMFEAEWQDFVEENSVPSVSDIGAIPPLTVGVNAIQAEAEGAAKQYKAQLDQTRAIANQAKESWEKLRKERDYHRMHHSRVIQEKNILIRDLARLKKHAETFEPAINEMRNKYESAMRDKMLMKLERDRMKSKSEALETQLKAWESNEGDVKEQSKTTNLEEKKARRKKGVDTPLPNDNTENPYLNLIYDPVPAHRYQLRKSFKGHRLAISSAVLHPTKPILATVSDDMSFKLWALPKGDLIMSGEGHKDWISSGKFNAEGHLFLTGSGDGMIKLWDLTTSSCTHTFLDHTQAVWDVAWHHAGDFFASCSMDHTAKLWDVNTGKCRQTFRGHVDSINSCVFAPYSSILCTSSGDKTVSLWDLRSGLCIQTLYGHQNAVLHASFSLKADTIVSSDADGIVKVWDVRNISEKAQLVCAGLQAINEVQLDRSAQVAALASDDGTVKIFSMTDGKHLADLEGHEDSVQSVCWDPQGNFLVSAGSDCTFKIWS